MHMRRSCTYVKADTSVRTTPPIRAGHRPIAVTSTASAPFALAHGAVGVVAYNAVSSNSSSPDEEAKRLARGQPIRHALNCITSPESAATCFAAIGRAVGRYACLEGFSPAWRTRRAVRVKEVMGFEGFGHGVELNSPGSPDGEGGLARNDTYSRKANGQLYSQGPFWRDEVQDALDLGHIVPHPVRELEGKWEGVVIGLDLLQRGEVQRQKLVVAVT